MRILQNRLTSSPWQAEIILIAGPSASGKSALALALARKLSGIILNADAMQVYRDFRIITARPTPRTPPCAAPAVGHVDAAENYSVGRWRTEAAATLVATERYGRAVIVVGGTGLYFKALTRGLAGMPPISPEVRKIVPARLAGEGIAALHVELNNAIQPRRRD